MPVNTWRDLVSSKVGIVTSLSPQMRDVEESLPPYLYTAMLANTPRKPEAFLLAVNVATRPTESASKGCQTTPRAGQYCAAYGFP